MGNRVTISNISTSANTLVDQWFVVDDGLTTRKLKGSQILEIIGSNHTHSQYATSGNTMSFLNKTIADYSNNVHADVLHGRIKANENIVKGDPLQYDGYNSGEMAVEVVKIDSPYAPCIGIAAQNLSLGEFGEMITHGILKNTDTSSYSANTILYASTSGFTEVEPQSGFSSPVAFVLRSHAINGVIMVSVGYPKQDTSDIRGISAYMQTLLDDGTAADARNTLGIYDDGIVHSVTGLTSAVTLTFTSVKEVFELTITQNTTITFTGDTTNSEFDLWVNVDAIGRTLVFPSGTKIQYPTVTEQIEFIDSGVFLITGRKLNGVWYLSYTIDPYE